MSKKARIIFVAIWLAVSGSLFAVVYPVIHHREKTKNEAYSDFVRRWNAEYKRGTTANEKLVALAADLNLLMEKSVRPQHEFGRAEMLMTTSDENLSNALEVFKKIRERFKKNSTDQLDSMNDLLSLTEKPLKRAEELNGLLEQELKDLKKSEPPK